MAEGSKGRVTITLGRGGQVVKRSATMPEAEHPGSLLGAGSKRSVRDRLGSSLDSSSSRGSQVSNKRQRGGSYLTSLGTNGMGDVRVGKDDLRFKLMQKNVFRRDQRGHKTMDLREKIPRTMQPLEPPVRSMDRRQHMPEPESHRLLGRIPSTRSADDLPRMGSSRNSYSAWTLDHIKQRSPDRVFTSRGLSPSRSRRSPGRVVTSRGFSPSRRRRSPGRVITSRGLSPLRNMEELQQRPLSRTFGDMRTVSYMDKDVLDAPRSISRSTTFVTKSALSTVSAKPAASLSQLPPPSCIVPKSSYTVEERQTVEGLLHSLGLGKYAIHFKAEEVDMAALKQMGEKDLIELGIPMGPRKKILLALLPRSRRQP